MNQKGRGGGAGEKNTFIVPSLLLETHKKKICATNNKQTKTLTAAYFCMQFACTDATSTSRAAYFCMQSAYTDATSTGRAGSQLRPINGKTKYFLWKLKVTKTMCSTHFIAHHIHGGHSPKQNSAIWHAFYSRFDAGWQTDESNVDYSIDRNLIGYRQFTRLCLTVGSQPTALSSLNHHRAIAPTTPCNASGSNLR